MTLMIVSGGVALVVAVLAARPAGRALRTLPKWSYWAANAAVLVVAMGLLITSTVMSNEVLWGLGLGIGFGGLAGLRYGLKGLFEVHAADRS